MMQRKCPVFFCLRLYIKEPNCRIKIFTVGVRRRPFNQAFGRPLEPFPGVYQIPTAVSNNVLRFVDFWEEHNKRSNSTDSCKKIWLSKCFEHFFEVQKDVD